jgi:hypothetical protein
VTDPTGPTGATGGTGPTGAKSKKLSALEGWILLLWIALLLGGLVPAVLAVRGTELAGVRAGLTLTARLSLALFLLAFTASSLARLWPAPLTRWLLRNRRYLGVSFALSHTVHLALIGTLVPLEPARFVERPASLIPGGIAYLFVFALAATSTDRTAAWLGSAWWKRLHRSGVWYIWLIFAGAYAADALRAPIAAAASALLLATALLRAIAWGRARRPQAASSTIIPANLSVASAHDPPVTTSRIPSYSAGRNRVRSIAARVVAPLKLASCCSPVGWLRLVSR